MNNLKYFDKEYQVMNEIFHYPYKYQFHQVIEMVDKLIPKVLIKNKMLILIVLHWIMMRDVFDVF